MRGKRSFCNRFYILPFFVLVLFIFSGFSSFATDFNNFSFRLPTAVSSDSSNKIVSRDFDGDGDSDLFLANDGQNRLLLNDGAGVFTTTASVLPVDTAKSRGVAVGDINGGVDIFIANFDSPNVVLLNDGGGTFTDGTSTWFPGDSMLSVSAAFGDLEGNGSNYLVVGNSTAIVTDSIKIYKNTGSILSDVTSTWITSAQAKFVSKVILQDVSGDSFPDLIVMCSVETQNRIYINNGGTSFTDSTSTNIPSLTKSSASAAVGDVDGVNGLDIFVVNEGGSSSRLLINDGTGVFTDTTGIKYPVDTNHSNDAVFGDVDDDGDLDIIVANGNTKVGSNGLENDSSKGSNVIFLNNGSGKFTEASSTVFTDNLNYNSTGAAVIDVSGKPFNILFSNGLGDGSVLYSKETASLYSVSGTVTISTGDASVTGVIITLSGNSVLSTTNPLSDGSYSFSDLEGGSSFTLTPSLSGYESDPPAITVTSIVTDTTGQDFTLTSTVTGDPPKITKFKPKKIKPLKTLKITGKNFGGKSKKGSVIFRSKGDADGIEGKVTKWANKEIKVKVPFGADTGKITVKTLDNQTAKKKLKITPIKPSIGKITPKKKIVPGKKITIKGSNFGSSQEDGELEIGGTSADVSNWGNKKITAIVPDLTKKKASVKVTTHYGSKSKKVKVKK